jgi:hypothetical protein
LQFRRADVLHDSIHRMGAGDTKAGSNKD